MITLQNTSDSELVEGFWNEFQNGVSHFEKEEKIIIGLAGGSSFDIFYAVLSERFHEVSSEIRKKIYFAFLDERVVPLGHDERNEFQLRTKFLMKLLSTGLIGEEQILSLDIGADDIAGAYFQKVPHIHIGLFGVGLDGHIASLFPHHVLLGSEEYSYLEIRDSPKPPPHRITVSPRMIQEIPFAFIIFLKGKEVAYSRFLDDNYTIEECPAKLVKQAKNTFLITDIKI